MKRQVKTFEQHQEVFYTRKELIELLDLDGLSDINYSDGEIETNEEEIELFKSELNDAFNMTLEEYSKTSQKLYDFLFYK